MLNRTITALAAASLALAGAAATAPHASADDTPPSAGASSLRVERAAFVTPTGNLSCTLDDTGVTCAAAQHDWPNLDVQCPSGEGGNLMQLTDAPRPTCAGDPLKYHARLGGSSSMTDYYAGLGAQRRDVTYAGESGTYAGLAYGTSLHNDRFSVTVTTEGVTATNLQNGRSFHLSKQVVESR